jgi:hypothetical protein
MVFRFGDFDNDGNVDFTVARQDGMAYFGNGNGGFQKKDNGLPSTGNFGADYVFAADTDGDGTDELGFCMNGGIHVYKWNATSNIWQNASGVLPASGSFYTMNIADLNSDGFMDIAAVSTSACSIYLGNGTNTWTPSTTVTIQNMNFPQAMATGDLDHNGRPEILILARFPVGWFNSINKLYLLNEQTVASANSIMPVSPYRDQCLPNNAVRFIKWQSEQAPGTITRVNLELSLTGANGTFDTIAINLPDNGIYQWTVPAAVSSPNCVIRFTQTDVTGSIQLSAAFSELFNIGCDSLSALNEHQEIIFNVYPNPATDQITINMDQHMNGPVDITISDLSGRMILHQLLEHPATLTVGCNNFEAGTYVISMKTQNKLSGYRKFTIIKN